MIQNVVHSLKINRLKCIYIYIVLTDYPLDRLQLILVDRVQIQITELLIWSQLNVDVQMVAVLVIMLLKIPLPV